MFTHSTISTNKILMEYYRFSWMVNTFGARWTVNVFRAVTLHLHLHKTLFTFQLLLQYCKSCYFY